LIQQDLKTKGFAGGKKGKVSSLFTHLLICSWCGYLMSHENKGSKGGQRFKCKKEKYKIKGGCSSKTIPYDLVETKVLTYWQGIGCIRYIAK